MKRRGYRRVDGYIAISVSHSRNNLEHILVATKTLGKPLPKGAIVHHANGDRADNRPENLVICPSHSYHMLLHMRMKAIAAGNPEWRQCHYCKKHDAPENLYIRGDHARHKKCFNEAWRRKYYASDYNGKRKARKMSNMSQTAKEK